MNGWIRWILLFRIKPVLICFSVIMKEDVIQALMRSNVLTTELSLGSFLMSLSRGGIGM